MEVAPAPGFRAFAARKAAAYVSLSILGTIGASLIPLFLATYHRWFFVGELGVERVSTKLLGHVYTSYGLDLLTLMFLSLPLIFVVLLAISFATEWLIWAFRLDRNDFSWSSLGWSLRSAPAFLLWLIALSILPAIAFALPGDGSLTGLATLVVAIFLLGHPFITLNPGNLSGALPSPYWRPAWPGSQAVMICCLLGIAWISLEFLSNLISGFLARDSTTGFIAAAVGKDVLDLFWIIPASVGLYVWLNHTDWSDARSHLRRILSRQTLGPLLATELRFLAIGIPLALPVLAVAILLIFVVPQVDFSLQESNQSFSPLILGSIRLARWLGEFGSTPLGLILTWFSSVAAGRLYFSIGMIDGRGTAQQEHGPSTAEATAPPLQ